MSSALPESTQLNTPELLEAFFERSQDGFFFMMLDQPVEWGPGVDKEAVLDYVFSHQRMTKVNPAMAAQFRARREDLIGLTPGDFFRHDLKGGRRGWRALFDSGHTHSVTNERRLDGSTMWVEGDYMCFYDAAGRITGHFGIQRDVSDRVRAADELEQSRAELRALAARLLAIREEERTRIAREIHDELGQALTALKLDLAWLGSKRPKGARNSGALRVIDSSITTRIDETMQIVRRIASELRPSVLDQLGLEAAIEFLVRDTAQRTGIAITLHADDFPRLPDDHPIVRQGLRRIVEADAAMVIAGEADDAAALLRALETTATDLVLLDVSMPGGLFLETLRELRTRHPTVRVLTLSVHPEDEWAVRALRAGASGYLTKDHSPEQLLEAIRRVYRGGKYVSSTLAEQLAMHLDVGGGQPV